MKALVLLFSLFSSSVFAAAPDADIVSTVEVLLSNPTLMTELRKAGTGSLTGMDVASDAKSNVNTYTMTFSSTGFSFPAASLVVVTQDMTPTFADGAPIYTATISAGTAQLNAVSTDLRRVVHALLAVENVGVELQKNFTTEMFQLEILDNTPVKNITTYKMAFRRGGRGGLLTTAWVEITEDFHPTIMDAPANYVGTVQIAH